MLSVHGLEASVGRLDVENVGSVPGHRVVTFVSWWPHDNMHIHNGNDLQGLLYIEYGFHVTLMAAGLVLAYSLLTMLRAEDAGVHDSGVATARVR